jgi:hypothetical protein
MRRDLNTLVNQPAQYELCFGNKFHVKPSGYMLKSTGFKTTDSTETLYISDIPDTNSKNTGKIIFFKLDVENNPIIIKNNAGTINYDKGEILIDTVTFNSTVAADDIVEIQALPESNDIVGLKDLYLKLDISKSKFEAISDTLSTGINASGTQFVTTSSYLNGNYTR